MVKGFSTCVLVLTQCHRYANMDFIVFSSLIGTTLQLIVFSYDIACQWSRNLPRWLQQLPEVMHLTADQIASARFIITSMHTASLVKHHSLSTSYRSWLRQMGKNRNDGGPTSILSA